DQRTIQRRRLAQRDLNFGWAHTLNGRRANATQLHMSLIAEARADNSKHRARREPASAGNNVADVHTSANRYGSRLQTNRNGRTEQISPCGRAGAEADRISVSNLSVVANPQGDSH